MIRSALELTVVVVLLTFFGLVMVHGTTTAEVIERSKSMPIEAQFMSHVLHTAASLLICIIVYWIGHTFILQHSFEIAVLIFCGILLVYIPGVGMRINGSSRWVNFLGISVQPSEFAKYFFPLALFNAIQRRKKLNLQSFFIILSVYMVGVSSIFFQPDNGTVFVLLTMLSVALFLSKVPLKYWVPPLIALSVLGGALAYNMPYVSKRLSVYMNPELDILGRGHQPYQAKIAAGSGGAFGKGLGKSMQKLSYLPEARSDYIAAIIAEEFGFLGVSIVLCLYMYFGLIALKNLYKADTEEEAGMGMIAVFLLLFQVFIHFGVVSGLLPSKGSNLPFISHGGSSMFISAILVGILLSITSKRQGFHA